MIFTETPLSGAFIVAPDPVRDSRGHFARLFCAREFAAHGLDASVAQCSVSFNERRGTLRGMHFQATPHQEAKTIRCIKGALYDVIVDLRPGSPTLYSWFGLELTEGGVALHVPGGFAHGFITLRDETAVEYIISTFYVAEAACGVRFDDPTLAITWPESPLHISERDRSLPLVQDLRAAAPARGTGRGDDGPTRTH